MTNVLVPRRNSGAVVDTTVSCPTRENASTVLDTLEDSGLQPSEEYDTQHDWPYSYQFWKTAVGKIANAEAILNNYWTIR